MQPSRNALLFEEDMVCLISFASICVIPSTHVQWEYNKKPVQINRVILRVGYLHVSSFFLTSSNEFFLESNDWNCYSFDSSECITDLFCHMNAKGVNSPSFSDKDQDLVLLQLEAETLKYSRLLLST